MLVTQATHLWVFILANHIGGVDDYLVSPRLDVEEGEVFSFWAQVVTVNHMLAP